MKGRSLPACGFLLAWLSLGVQLALAALGPGIVLLPTVVTAAPICHTGDPSDAPPPGGQHHPADNCLVCPLCASLAIPWTLPAVDPAAALPRRIFIISRPALPPPSTAGPAPQRLNPQPRAPPIQA